MSLPTANRAYGMDYRDPEPRLEDFYLSSVRTSEFRGIMF
jgi:hypothetical protein